MMSFIKWCELCEAEGIRSPVCMFQINFTEAIQMCKRPECLDLVRAKDFQSLLVRRDVSHIGQKKTIPENAPPIIKGTPNHLPTSVEDSFERFFASLDDHPPQLASNNPVDNAHIMPPKSPQKTFSDVVPSTLANDEVADRSLAYTDPAVCCSAKQDIPSNSSAIVEEVMDTTSENSGANQRNEKMFHDMAIMNERSSTDNADTVMTEDVPNITCEGNCANPPKPEIELNVTYIDTKRKSAQPPETKAAQPSVNNKHECNSTSSLVTPAQGLQEHDYTKPPDSMQPNKPITSDNNEKGGVSMPESCATCDDSGFEHGFQVDLDTNTVSDHNRQYSIEAVHDEQMAWTAAVGSSEPHNSGGSLNSSDDAMHSCLRIAETVGFIDDNRGPCIQSGDPPGTSDHFIMVIGASVDVAHQAADEGCTSFPFGEDTHEKHIVELKAAVIPNAAATQSLNTDCELAEPGGSDAHENVRESSSPLVLHNLEAVVPEKRTSCRQSRNGNHPAARQKQGRGSSRSDMEGNTKGTKTLLSTHVTGPVQSNNQNEVSAMNVHQLQSVPTVIEYHTPEGFCFYEAVVLEGGTGSFVQVESRHAPKRKLSPDRQPLKPQQPSPAVTRNVPVLVDKLAMIKSVLQTVKSSSQGTPARPPQPKREKRQYKRCYTSNEEKPKKPEPKMNRRRAPKESRVEPSIPDYSLSQRSPVNSEDGSSSSKQSSGSDGTQESSLSLLRRGPPEANVSSSTFIQMVRDQVKARTRTGSGFAGYHPVLAKKPPFTEEKEPGRSRRKTSASSVTPELDEAIIKLEKSKQSQYDSLLEELHSLA